MKFILSLLLSTAMLFCSAQSQQFDLVSFTPINDWKAISGPKGVQLSRENKTDGSYCIITLFRSVPGSSDPQQNFNTSWETLVKSAVKTTAAPHMQPPAKQKGWEACSGFAPFESDGQKGMAMLVTSTGYSKMVNIMILTNTNAYETELTGFLASLQLAVPDSSANGDKTTTPSADPVHSGNSSFAFTSTNFDDGWTSTVREDWVEISKPGIRILVHYPNQKTDRHNFNKLEGDQHAWNTLVAPRYSSVSNFLERGIQDYQSVTFLTADGTEKQSGKKVHIVLYKKHYDKGNGRYLEVVADNQAVFEREFGNNYINRSSWDYMSQAKSWDKLADMQWKNKFAVAAGDLTGKWSSSTYASLAYYYVNGGGFAGATATSISDEFTFLPGNKYESDHAGASGVTGNQKFSRQVYKGNALVSNWNMTLTNRFRGESEKYDCYFEAIKGGRILILTDRLGTTLSLVKSK